MSETILAIVGYALIGLLIGVIMARKMVGNPSQFGYGDREGWLFVFWVAALLWPLVILAGGVWLVLSGCSRLALRVGRAELRLPRKPGPQDLEALDPEQCDSDRWTQPPASWPTDRHRADDEPHLIERRRMCDRAPTLAPAYEAVRS